MAKTQKKENLEILTNELKPEPVRIYLIARALDRHIKKFYENPANVAAFEEWKSKQGGKQNAKVKRNTNSKG